MSDYALKVLENIAILAAMALMVWVTDSYWWALLLLLINNTQPTNFVGIATVACIDNYLLLH